MFHQLAKDKRVENAIQSLLDAVDDATAHISSVRPPQPGKKTQYKQLLATLTDLKGGPLFYPYLGAGIGRGPYVQLADGSIKLDFINGIGAHSGHMIPELIETNVKASLSDVVMQGNLQQNIESVTLMTLLTTLSGMDHCFLTTSGAMAVENGLKICMQHRFPAQRILAFNGCFMGRTLAVASITDKAAYRQGLPNTLNVDYVPFYDDRNPKKSIVASVATLENLLKRYPKQHAAFCMELVQGENGYYPGRKAFFDAIIAVCKQHDIPILIDEIQTFARTGELFAADTFGTKKDADVLLVGKLSQVCATLFREPLKPRPGLISQTFTGSTTAIHSAILLLEQFKQKGLFGAEGRVQAWHNHAVRKLKALGKAYPDTIAGPYGIGSMLAFTYKRGEPAESRNFVKSLFQEGLMGFIAGSDPVRIRFLFPLLATNKQIIDEAMALLEKTIRKERS